ARVQVVTVNVRVAAPIRRVTKREPARHPRRRGDDRFIIRDAYRVVAVEIGKVNLAVRTGIHLEGDLGLGDAFAVEGTEKVIGKSVRLPAQRGAIVAFA